MAARVGLAQQSGCLSGGIRHQLRFSICRGRAQHDTRSRRGDECHQVSPTSSAYEVAGVATRIKLAQHDDRSRRGGERHQLQPDEQCT